MIPLFIDVPEKRLLFSVGRCRAAEGNLFAREARDGRERSFQKSFDSLPVEKIRRRSRLVP
jgi:hypothetical protein